MERRTTPVTLKHLTKVTIMEKCPHCGSDLGYYHKAKASGTIYERYKFDGSRDDNSQMWDYMNIQDYTTAYCQDCEKKLPEISKENLPHLAQ